LKDETYLRKERRSDVVKPKQIRVKTV